MFKFGKIGPRSESNFSGSAVWFSSPRQLNDPFECRPSIPGADWWPLGGDFFFQDLISEKLAVYCVSRTVDNILLWSHYSDEHKGYCLAFSEAGLCSHFADYGNVIYQDDYPEINVHDTSPETQALLFVLTKFSGWSYEREVRFLSYGTGAGLREYPTQHLRAVILGARMDDASRITIREWLSKREVKPIVYDARLSTRRFGLEFRQAQ